MSMTVPRRRHRRRVLLLHDMRPQNPERVAGHGPGIDSRLSGTLSVRRRRRLHPRRIDARREGLEGSDVRTSVTRKVGDAQVAGESDCLHDLEEWDGNDITVALVMANEGATPDQYLTAAELVPARHGQGADRLTETVKNSYVIHNPSSAIRGPRDTILLLKIP